MIRNRLRVSVRLPALSTACFLAAAIVLGSLMAGTDLLPFEAVFHRLINHHAADDVFAALVLIIAGLGIASAERKARHRIEVQEQRLRVLKATMRTVHDVVNNFLNSIQLFRLDAEDALPPESLALFDQLCSDTAAKLKILGDLESVPEKERAAGASVDIGT